MSDAPTPEETVDRPWYPTPQAAVEGSRPEETLYVAASHVGTGTDAPDLVAVVDVAPDSGTRGAVVHEVRMPSPGDGLHHIGWNAWASTPPGEGPERRYLVVPGHRSSRIHFLDTADERHPSLESSTRPEDLTRYDLAVPHTVRAVPGGGVVVSMLATADGDSPAGFVEIDEEGFLAGRYDEPGSVEYNGDFWYQPRSDVAISTAWPSPGATGDDLDLSAAGAFGREVLVWDWSDRMLVRSLDLGASGELPCVVRFLHNPDSTDAYLAAARSSTLFHLHLDDGIWYADPVIEFEARDHPDHGSVPAFPVDLLVSMDDRYLFCANWLAGEVRMFDVSDPSHPRRVDGLSVGGLHGDVRSVADRPLAGGPATLQLSLDGTRLYWTTSCEPVWDDQFFPAEGRRGSVLLKADVDPRRGTMTLDEEFLVDFGQLDPGPARAGGMRWPDADPTGDVWE